MKLYIVIANAYMCDYGKSNHCLGVFTSKESAEKVRQNYITLVEEYFEKKYEGRDKIILHHEECTLDRVVRCYSICDIIELDQDKEYGLRLPDEEDGWDDLLEGDICVGEYLE